MRRISPPAAAATFVLGVLAASALAIYLNPQPWWLPPVAFAVAFAVTRWWATALRPLAAGALLAGTGWALLVRFVVSGA
jgi:4-hydroxybenzoate polyprenyltransferase